ncbi:hypothetical protein BDA96_07G150200 [Sorghum bicolor]|uniref:Uncharacterized protein n=2 Tax=Sorghum bicolor TaxID=4558 RepID=A0A921QKU8_SORBI|nr:hypothetical protein BDA96_07G150200 [Sorghum bicolor]OQU80524.1 hypothetical protein SORBI_3007G139800 [Sorghum bicolor]
MLTEIFRQVWPPRCSLSTIRRCGGTMDTAAVLVLVALPAWFGRSGSRRGRRRRRLEIGRRQARDQFSFLLSFSR